MSAAGAGEPARSVRAGVLPGGADAAVWAFVDRATRRAADEVVETLEAREVVAKLAARYAGHANPQRAGHLFEVMHAVGFNRHAARVGSPVRARVVEWVEGGSQNGKADVWLVRGGRVLSAAQAKLMGSVPRTVHAVARPEYAGMDVVVAADKLAAVDSLFDRRLAMTPEGLRYRDYADARSRVTDRLSHGSVHSTPVTYEQAQAAAQDPIGWADRQVAAAAGREIATGAAAGAAAGALVGAVVSAAGVAARARAGETSAGAAVVTVVGAAARNAARSGGLAAVAASVRVAAGAGRMPAALGRGTVPAAMADAVWGVADAGLDLAHGRIDAGEFAARSCAATTRASLVWAGGVVGQTAIPIPVVGALVGGVVGQAAAALVTQGLQLAIVAARADRADPGLLAVLEAEAMTTAATAAVLREATRALGDEQGAYATRVVLPELAHVHAALGGPDPAGAVGGLATATRTHASQPIFTTDEEFDRWMADHDAPLTLDPNW